MPLTAAHPVRCTCGRVSGILARGARYVRATCYCRDCRAYARALRKANEVLDPLGGTNVIATLQQYLSFTSGRDGLACLSLAPRGLLRWYAACCGAPLANTTRDPKLSYAGVLHTALGGTAAMDRAFGPTRMAVNTKSALGEVRNDAFRALVSTAGILGSVALARANGTWRRSPFFDAQGRAVAQRRVLAPEERAAAYREDL